MALDGALRALRGAGAIATAVVSRDGSVLAADLPADVSKETFSIMCATIHGAGMTVSNQLRRGGPGRIVLESDEGCVLITEAGRRALLVIVLPADGDLQATTDRLKPFVDQVIRESA